ncbi:hypothetical protein BB561_004854 [Smittium simulii]|uniref:Adhesin domain-containing protein n=1 Tax=Smittium simulii TaxID=133385 RepID=A0A2T9YDU9_9FUNG|nr:hypothetical protein BB561_004854 [Smittium simulii]
MSALFAEKELPIIGDTALLTESTASKVKNNKKCTLLRRISLFFLTLLLLLMFYRARFLSIDKHSQAAINNTEIYNKPYESSFAPHKKHGRKHHKAHKQSAIPKKFRRYTRHIKHEKQRLVNYFRYAKRQEPISFINSYNPVNYTRIMVYTRLDIPVNVTFGYSLDDTQTIQFSSDLVQSKDLTKQVSVAFTPNDRQGVTLYINPPVESSLTGYADSGAHINVNITLPKTLETLTTLLINVINGQATLQNSIKGNGIENFNFQAQKSLLRLNGLNATSTTIATGTSNIDGIFNAGSSLSISSVSGNTNVLVITNNAVKSSITLKSKNGNIKLMTFGSTFSGNYKVQSIVGDSSVIDVSNSDKLVVTDNSKDFKSGSFNLTPGLALSIKHMFDNLESQKNMLSRLQQKFGCRHLEQKLYKNCKIFKKSLQPRIRGNKSFMSNTNDRFE